MSQKALSLAAKIGLSSVKRFEAEELETRVKQIEAMEAVFRERGVIFLNNVRVGDQKVVGVAMAMVPEKR
jgi:hypothetical protein